MRRPIISVLMTLAALSTLATAAHAHIPVCWAGSVLVEPYTFVTYEGTSFGACLEARNATLIALSNAGLTVLNPGKCTPTGDSGCGTVEDPEPEEAETIVGDG